MDNDIEKAKLKAEEFFSKPREKNKIQERLKSLKEQIELPVSESVDIVPSEIQQNLTKIDKLSILTDLTGDQLDFINLMIPMEFNITDICAEIGISRSTYYNWLEDNEAFKTAYENTREYLVDKAEQVLLKSMNSMDAKTAQFVLKALTKRYKDKIDITTNGESINKISFEVTLPKNGNNS